MFSNSTRRMNDLSRHLPSFAELLEAVRRHWLKGCFAACLVLGVSVVGIFMLPRQYASEAKLFVKVGRETLALDPTATTGQLVSIFESRDTEINSLLEVLRSRAVLERVVDVLSTDVILHNAEIPVDLVAAAEAAKRNLGDTAPYSAEREKAIIALERSLEIGSPKRTSVVNLRMKSESPQLAQAVLAVFLIVFREFHADANTTRGSYDFFASQEKLLKAKWDAAAEELRIAKDELELATIEGKRTMLQSQLSDLEQKLLSARGETAASNARSSALRTEIGRLPEFTETTRAEAADNAADTMQGMRYGLEIKEKELLARFTEDHPAVTAVRKQLADLAQASPAGARTRVQATSARNSNRSQLELTLANQDSELFSLAARETALVKQRTETLASLRALNLSENRLSQLQRNVELSETAYRDTAVRLEQARMNREIERQRISNVNVVQEASFISKAVGPKRTMLLGLSGIASGFLGTLVILGFGFLERYFRSREEASQRLRLPVAGSFGSFAAMGV